MKGLLWVLGLILVSVGGASRVRAAAADRPQWAYPVNGSGAAGVRACDSCHLPNGFGRPDSAGLAGLPAAYIAEQIANYRKGLRRSSEPRMGPVAAMVAVAEAVGPAEVQAAAERFATMTPAPWIRVVEIDTLPRARVVEVPEHREGAELRDTTSGFVAYVPTDSIRRGEALVTTGGSGKTVRCTICHGNDLKGVGSVPGIAGRSPSYLARQLYDMQQGTRHGPRPDLMMGAVARLTEADIVAIVAYAASRVP